MFVRSAKNYLCHNEAMKLLQLNAWSIRLATRVADMVDQEAPDVINFQEVMEAEVDLGFFPTLSELAEKLRFHHIYFGPVYSMQFMGRRAEWGNGIISNLAFEDKNTIFTNHGYKENISFEEDDYNVRNFQHVVVRDQNDKPVHILNHHGYHVPEHKNGNEFTLKACQQIDDYAKSLDGPVIITGDFNLDPTSESLTVLNDHFRNLTTEFHLETTRTDLTHKTEACDYIFVNDKVIVKDFHASSVVASDHQGLVLEFELA